VRVNSVRERLGRIPRRHLVLGAVAIVVVLVLVMRMSGSGSSATPNQVPATGTPVASTATPGANATAAGARVLTDAHTPAAFTTALRNQQIIVVGFVMGGIADDDAVAAALAGLASPQEAVPGVRYLVYNVARSNSYGDLATILGVSGTPSVVVIGTNGRIANAWNQYVDASVVSAAIQQALNAPVG
jgi:hypothetical protein